jgi:hypothetical protein
MRKLRLLLSISLATLISSCANASASTQAREVLPEGANLGFGAILKKRNLGAWRRAC